MTYKKKTRFRKRGRAGGMTILRMHPEVDERKKNIYFRDLGRLGAAAAALKPDPTGQSVGMYPCR